jgi:hypothetical protein
LVLLDLAVRKRALPNLKVLAWKLHEFSSGSSARRGCSASAAGKDFRKPDELPDFPNFLLK